MWPASPSIPPSTERSRLVDSHGSMVLHLLYVITLHIRCWGSMVAGRTDTNCSRRQGLQAWQAEGAAIASVNQEGDDAMGATLARRPPRSLLQASVLLRCLWAVAVCALLWLAVAWAMGGV